MRTFDRRVEAATSPPSAGPRRASSSTAELGASAPGRAHPTASSRGAPVGAGCSRPVPCDEVVVVPFSVSSTTSEPSVGLRRVLGLRGARPHLEDARSSPCAPTSSRPGVLVEHDAWGCPDPRARRCGPGSPPWRVDGGSGGSVRPRTVGTSRLSTYSCSEPMPVNTVAGGSRNGSGGRPAVGRDHHVVPDLGGPGAAPNTEIGRRRCSMGIGCSGEADPHGRDPLRGVADEPGVHEFSGRAGLAGCGPVGELGPRAGAPLHHLLEGPGDEVGDRGRQRLLLLVLLLEEHGAVGVDDAAHEHRVDLMRGWRRSRTPWPCRRW